MNFLDGSGLAIYADFGKSASKSTLKYLRRRKEKFRSNFVSDTMRRLFDHHDRDSRNLNMRVLEDEMRVARRRESKIYDDGRITYIDQVLDMQHMNRYMRELVMSDTDLRKMSRSGMIEGWSGHYRESQPGVDGSRNRNWRRVNEGIYRKTEELEHETSSYFYEERGANELTLTEKLDALRTIDRMKALIRKGNTEDPTSLNGGFIT